MLFSWIFSSQTAADRTRLDTARLDLKRSDQLGVFDESAVSRQATAMHPNSCADFRPAAHHSAHRR
jgi:hypothetical protein